MRFSAMLALASAVAGSPAGVVGPAARPAGDAGGCGGRGRSGFVCGLTNVEDLVPLPGGRLLVGSAMQPGGAGLYRIDTATRTARPIALSVGASRDPRYPRCAAPNLTRLATHGLDVTANRDGTATIYAVNHGGRESVEIFRLDAAGAAAAWVGCLILPAGASGNAVVALPGGRIAISRFEDAGDTQGIVKVLAGQTTGLVYVWTPGRGFAVLPHSRMSGPNGLAASPDGRWLFVNEYGRKRIWRLPLDGKGEPANAAVPFQPDNIRWGPGGTLLVTGQFVAPGQLAGPHDWATVRLEPRSMAVMPLLKEPGRAAFGGATTAVQIGGTLWIGTFRGDRIAYRPVPGR